MISIDVQTANQTPAQTTVKLADIIGIKLESVTGSLGRWCKEVQAKRQPEKLLVTPNDFHYFKSVPLLKGNLNFINIKEGYIVSSSEPFVIYCLKGSGLSRLAISGDTFTQEDLSECKSILLSEGNWFFFTQVSTNALMEEIEVLKNNLMLSGMDFLPENLGE